MQSTPYTPPATRSTWIASLVCALLLGVTVPSALGQTLAQADQMSAKQETSTARLLSLLDGHATMPALQRTVRLDLHDVPFERALQTIAFRADFGVSYNPALIPQRTITLPSAQRSVRRRCTL